MSVENNNSFMTTITKNPLVSLIAVIVIVGVIVIIVKMSGSEEGFSYPSSYDTKDIVENYPQSTPMNVMYSDAAGNLGTTTDLGLQNLTVKSDSSFGGAVTANRFLIGGDLHHERAVSVNKGSGDWNTQIHNPTSGVHVLMAHGGKYGMHINANNKDLDTYALQCVGGDKQLMILNGKGNMNVAGKITSEGRDILGELNALRNEVNALRNEVNTLNTINNSTVKYNDVINITNRDTKNHEEHGRYVGFCGHGNCGLVNVILSGSKAISALRIERN
jgi:hypothetical protein